jgi:hypothetical protein
MDAIRSVERWLAAPLPRDYVAFLATHTEDALFGDRYIFYDATSLIERNTTFASKVYCPGYIIIGNDSGGRAVVIPIDRPLGEVFLVDHGAMTPDCFVKMAQPFHEWLAEGCPLPAEPHMLKLVDVWLERLAPLAILVRIKNELAPELDTASLLRAAKLGKPSRLLRAVPFGRSLVRLRGLNAEHECLSMRRVDSDERVEWSVGARGAPASER